MGAVTILKGLFEKVWHMYESATLYLGDHRRFIHRACTLCLVLMGVHIAADLVDDAVFLLIGLLDDGMDALAFSLSDWLGSWSFFSEESMRARALFWAQRIGPEQKENLSLILALLTEGLVDLAVLDLAWGVRPSASTDMEFLNQQRFSWLTHEIRSAMRPFDLERVSVVPAMFFLCLSGAIVAGQGVERLCTDLWLWYFPNWLASRFSAVLGLLFTVLILWRMLPGILLGAYRRQLARAKESTPQALASVLEGKKRYQVRLLKLAQFIKRFRRTTFMTLLVLALATAALVGNGLWPMIARIWGGW